MKKNIIIVCLSLLFICTITTLRANQIVRFGVNNFYPPFVFPTSTGGLHGFDIEIAQSLCEEMHMKCVFMTMPLKDIFEKLNHGHIDAGMSAISVTPERKKKFDFTQSYLRSTMSYLGSPKTNIEIPSGLANRKVGVVKESSFYTYLNQTYGNKIKIKAYDTEDDAISDLAKNKIDLVLMDTPVARYWANQSNGSFKIIGKSEYLPSGEGYAIAVKKGNNVLLDQLNHALDAIKAKGSYTRAVHTYFTF